jgi:hypothetical protein
MPFCAMMGVGPDPVITSWSMSAVEPGPSTVMPFFW